ARTGHRNLIRHKSGRYYARAFAGGKEVWQSLKTSHYSVARARLSEFLKEHRERASNGNGEVSAKMTFGEAAAIHLRNLDDNLRIKPSTRERAVERSKATAWKSGQAPQSAAKSAAWPLVNEEQREAVIAAGAGLVELWEISPRRVDDNEPHTEEIIDALFPGDPLLCAGRSNYDFATRSREEWRGGLTGLQLVVP